MLKKLCFILTILYIQQNSCMQTTSWKYGYAMQPLTIESEVEIPPLCAPYFIENDDKGSNIYIRYKYKHDLCTERGAKIFGLTAIHLTTNLAIGCTEKKSFWSWLTQSKPEKKWYLYTTEIIDDTYYDTPTPIVIMKPICAIPELNSEEVRNFIFTEDGNTILAFLVHRGPRLKIEILKITPKTRIKNILPSNQLNDAFFKWT